MIIEDAITNRGHHQEATKRQRPPTWKLILLVGNAAQLGRGNLSRLNTASLVEKASLCLLLTQSPFPFTSFSKVMCYKDVLIGIVLGRESIGWL